MANDVSRATVRRPPRKRVSREEKSRLTREGLLAAGFAVVSAEGYAAASIAKIADAAGVAHGTFYNYFEDRQALFDELLPHEGLKMRQEVEEQARQIPNGIEREIQRFRAFLDYVAANRGFYRVLYEAEIFAPEAHRQHVANIVNGYKRTLQRGVKDGWLPRLSELEADCLIYQLLGMRAYSAMQIHYCQAPSGIGPIKDGAVASYCRLMTKGLAEARSA